MNEVWKPVVGHESSYEVSSHGNVRRLSGGRGARAGKMLKLKKHSAGYYCVSLYQNNKQTCALVHSLVAAAFIGPRGDKIEVNHIDAVKTNNRLENLEYCTRLENHRHAIGMGLVDYSYCRKHPLVKVCEWCGEAYLTIVNHRGRRKSCGQSCARKIAAKNVSTARKLQTHCKRGHRLSEGNIYKFRDKGGSVHRICKICTTDRTKRRRAIARIGGEIARRRLEGGAAGQGRGIGDRGIVWG